MSILHSHGYESRYRDLYGYTPVRGHDRSQLPTADFPQGMLVISILAMLRIFWRWAAVLIALVFIKYQCSSRLAQRQNLSQPRQKRGYQHALVSTSTLRPMTSLESRERGTPFFLRRCLHEGIVGRQLLQAHRQSQRPAF